jgi:hypothetical protein
VSSNLDWYERIAPLYDLLDLPFEDSRYRKIRPLLFQGLKGRVLDAGIGCCSSRACRSGRGKITSAVGGRSLQLIFERHLGQFFNVDQLTILVGVDQETF